MTFTLYCVVVVVVVLFLCVAFVLLSASWCNDECCLLWDRRYLRMKGSGIDIGVGV